MKFRNIFYFSAVRNIKGLVALPDAQHTAAAKLGAED